jgi:ParB-like chromosome segregation protein Spo0J
MFSGMVKVKVEDIVVGTRRRDDLGDIQSLAGSIRQVGLLHPIIIDENNSLIAGGRRLEAYRTLKREYIEARYFGALTEDEKREIELEENIRRKDLTALERSKSIVRLAEIAGRVNEREFRVSDTRNSPGRPSLPDSRRSVSERTGLDPKVIDNARTHVAATDKYPELANPTIPQKHALTISKNLDKLPEAEREVAREGLRRNDHRALTSLAELPPMPQEEMKHQKSGAERWAGIVTRLSQMVMSIAQMGGPAILIRNWPQNYRDSFHDSLVRLIDSLTDIKDQYEREIHHEAGIGAKKVS